MKDQATQRPWKVNEGDRMSVVNSNNGFICDTHNHPYPQNYVPGQYEANARLIVKAVNSFDLSVKAFNDILSSNNIEEIKGYANKMVQLLQDNKDS